MATFNGEFDLTVVQCSAFMIKLSPKVQSNIVVNVRASPRIRSCSLKSNFTVARPDVLCFFLVRRTSRLFLKIVISTSKCICVRRTITSSGSLSYNFNPM